MYTYALKSSMSDRSSLDEKAARDGAEDARQHYPDVLQEGTLKRHVVWLCEQALEQDETLTDDPEEYQARYHDAYIKAYTQTAYSLREDANKA